MPKPRLLDLFCCAGGAAMGYARAGFEVVGVDIKPQPRYPFRFALDDALEFLALNGADFDAIHASPPCQGYTTMGNRYRGKGGPEHDLLIDETRAALRALELPYVIENVTGAAPAMESPIQLHGGMFGLEVYRPRLFESNMDLVAPAKAPKPANVVGVYGVRPDGRRLWTRKDGTEQRACRSIEQAQQAMGIDWMTWPEITEAIPPAYTEYLGCQLFDHLQLRNAA